jgi:protein-S-isoprenylcysteine O-methyltransferase Ste14
LTEKVKPEHKGLPFEKSVKLKSFTKHIFSFILPITVLIIIPLSIEKNLSFKNIFAIIAGLFIICIGLFLIAVTISLFSRIGKGTLAPWSPTKKLVIAGLYRYVRNPMIIGVIIVLFGESTAILSWKILVWTVTFFIINNIYFTIYEEPNLEKKFGKEYQDYKSKVSRWVPRLRPYCPD